MMRTEVLPLRDVPDSSRLAVASELVACLTTIIEGAERGPDYEKLLGELKTQGAAFVAATEPEAIEITSERLLSTCRAAVAAVKLRQQARRQDIATLVKLVRETVESLAQGQA